MKKLWLLSQPGDVAYEEYIGAVVCAETEEEARNIHPSGDNSEFTYKEPRSWVNPEEVIVELIGTADDSFEEITIILNSYRAG